jgi:hypothetical protein
MEAFHMSVLEHEWMILFEAEDAHDIENICIKAGLGAFNTVKIVGLKSITMYMKKLENKQYQIVEIRHFN